MSGDFKSGQRLTHMGDEGNGIEFDPRHRYNNSTDIFTPRRIGYAYNSDSSDISIIKY